MVLTPAQHASIRAFCLRWGVRELWLFGSAARGTNSPESDVDLLVKFSPNAATSTWDWPAMSDELEAIFNAKIDLLSEGILRNPYRRAAILSDRQVLFAA